MNLGCAEFAVPGDSLEDKLKELESHEMWLELVNDSKRRAEDILRVQRNFNVPIKSVQAYLQHKMSMLSADTRESKAAVKYVKETLSLASDLGAENVVVIITYGKPKIDNPREKSIELFRHFGELGDELNVTISVEPLGRERTSFLPNASEVLHLVQEVGMERVRLMIDTMHVHSSGQNPAEVIEEFAPEIMEIQLRDTDSKPPGLGSIDFPPVMEVICRKFGGLSCLEYHPGSDSSDDFANALETVHGFISAAR